MKKTLFSIAFIGLFSQIDAQNTGINTTNPKATLDITAKTDASAQPEGILIPRLTGDQVRLMPIANLQESTMVYATSASTDLTAVKDKNLTQKGYFYWDGAAWQNVKGTAWDINGNAGTDPVVNFIGTTDDKDLVFKRFNTTAGLLNSSRGITVFGVNAMAGVLSNPLWTSHLGSNIQNTLFGYNVMKDATTNTYQNTIMGSKAYVSGIGNDNTVMGASTFTQRTDGSGNVGIGIYAFSLGGTNSYSAGDNNVGIGYSALGRINNLGDENVAIGYQAMSYKGANILGIPGLPPTANTMVGAFAGQYELKGSNNVGLGHYSYNGTSTGNDNLALGNHSLTYASSASRNTVVGNQSAPSFEGNNSIFLGYNTRYLSSTDNYTLNIGNSVLGTGIGDNDVTNDRIGIGLITEIPNYPYVGTIELIGSQPTNTLHVKATSNPVRFEGLQTSTDSTDKVVVADASGVLKTKDASAISSASEPWYVANIPSTTTPATSNTQDIFQMGKVGIGTNNLDGLLSIYNNGGNGGNFSIITNNSDGGAMDDTFYTSYGSTPYITDWKNVARGAFGSPLSLKNGDHLYDLTTSGYLSSNNSFNILSRYFIQYEGDGTNKLTSTQFINSNSLAMIFDKNNNVGIRNPTPNSTLQVSGSVSLPIRSLSGTVSDTDYTILGTGDVTLPDPTTRTGRIYQFVYDGTGYSVNGLLRWNGSNFGSYGLNSSNNVKGITVQSNGTRWVVISAIYGF